MRHIISTFNTSFSINLYYFISLTSCTFPKHNIYMNQYIFYDYFDKQRYYHYYQEVKQLAVKNNVNKIRVDTHMKYFDCLLKQKINWQTSILLANSMFPIKNLNL